MAKSHILQVVNGDGEFDENGVEEFIRRHSISDAGVGYQVVAITGPQSSGKSTLMNSVVSMKRRLPYFKCSDLIDVCRLWPENTAVDAVAQQLSPRY